MPLDKSRSKGAFSRNVATEMHAGRPQKQALAIAYSVQGKEKEGAAEDRARGEEKEPKKRRRKGAMGPTSRS